MYIYVYIYVYIRESHNLPASENLTVSLHLRPPLPTRALQMYEGVEELRVYRCVGGGTNDGAVYPSLQACRSSCSLTGGSCNSLSTVT